jgi:hypothetical protein
MKRLAAIVTPFLLAVAFADAASAAIGPKSDAGRIRPWSVQYMDGNVTVTQAQAVATAKTFDAIAALPKVYSAYVSAMKAANPNLQLYVYAKGMFTYDTTLPESAYSHDANGNRIQGMTFATWLLNPNSPAAVTAQATAAQSALAKSHYDGVFLDTMGVAALNVGQFVRAAPVNPATGQVWTSSDWMQATANFGGQIATALGKPVMANGLRDGKSYFTPTLSSELLTTGMTGGMAEAWIRGGSNSITAYPKEAAWKQNVDAIADAGARGSSFCAVTKVWTDGTQAQKDAWFTYTAASFLLGNNGNSYLAFTYNQGDATADYPLWHVDLGTATGPYAKVNNVYQRSFTAGRVLVNPTPNTYTIQLGATYHTLDGASVASVTLGPNSASILES